MSLSKAVGQAQAKLAKQNKIMRLEQMPGGIMCNHDNTHEYPPDPNSKHILKNHAEVVKHMKEHFGPVPAGNTKK